MPSCLSCATHVSPTYVRVLGDRDGEVNCPSCAVESRNFVTGTHGLHDSR